MQYQIPRPVFIRFLTLILFLLPTGFEGLLSESSPLIDIEKLETHVREIISVHPYRNFENPSSLNKTADYILKNFKKFGYFPKEQKYIANKIEYKNIEVRIGSGKGKKIVIGAHYDVAGEQFGADDNASGVAGLLEIARILKQNEKTLQYEIILVAYTLEEPPYFRTEEMGSYIHAKSLKDKNEDIELMIALETIGYFSDKKDSQDYPIRMMRKFYPTKGNFIAGIGGKAESEILKLLKEEYKENTNLPCETLVAPQGLKGVDFSDHLNYWIFGYKAIMITDTAFYRNKNYHETSDTIDTLDFQRMSETIKGIVLFILNNRI